jgi:mRNA interferase MazF
VRRGEIYLAEFPFGDTGATKLRPVLLLTGPVGIGTACVAAYISSVIPTALLPSDLLLDPSRPEHSTTRLKTVSVLRLHKIATIHRGSLRRRLGELGAGVQTAVSERLRGLPAL